jgi:cleavage stimulation factor subunit 2
LEGKTTIRGELVDLDAPENSSRLIKRTDSGESLDIDSDDEYLASLPAGIPVPFGASTLDVIGHALTGTNLSDLMEVLAQMKVRQPRKVLEE